METCMNHAAIRRRRLAFALGLALLSFACGHVKRDASGGHQPTVSSGGEGGGSGSGSGAIGGDDMTADNAGMGPIMPPPIDGVLHDESAGRLMMRRITNREYSNIMADLIGDQTNPGAAFPADGPSPTGFEAPNSVTELNVQYYNETADKLAETALTAGKLGLPPTCVNPEPAAELECATQFITAFGGKAYRRPVTAAEASDLQVLFQAARDPAPSGGGMTFAESIAQVAKGMLQSPNFLYHWELGPFPSIVDAATGLVRLTPHQIASRLSEMLWESMPDEALLHAADAEQLSTAEQVQAQALRLLGDPHAANALFNFHQQWLLQANSQVTDLTALSKSSAAFTPKVAEAMAGEFTRFLSSVYGAAGDGTLQALLTAPYTYVNQDLAGFYGNTTATGGDFARIQLDPKERGGILTQTAFLTANAAADQSDPVKRGLAVYANLLCGEVMPAAHASMLPALVEGKTTRQRFAESARDGCQTGCHAFFDAPGFAFENYDAVGVYRVTEAGQTIDASGSFTTPAGATIAFENAVDLSSRLAASSELQWCAGRKWLRYTLGRMESDAERGSLERAYRKAAETAGYSLRDLVLSIVGSTAFRFRAPSPGEAH